jgi:predicted branched-subunit amino acid permease
MGTGDRRRDGEERARGAAVGADVAARVCRHGAARGVAVDRWRCADRIVWATALCIILRFVVFSAQWRPYFGHFPLRKRLALSYFCADLNYVTFMHRFPEPKPAAGQVAYFAGGAITNWSSWQGSSLVGICAAEAVPTQWGLGFAGVLALLGMTYSLLNDRRAWIAAIVAGSAAVAAYALPLKLDILVAIAAAVAVGLVMERAKA